MAQNIYDNPDFFAGYSQLPRQVLGLPGAPEWPAIRALLPDLRGRRVVDLGCGFGWASRWMRGQGAASVLGLDVSQNMIERAVILTNGDVLQVGPLTSLTFAKDESATLRESERDHILHALEETKWLVGGAHGAAARLGLKRTTLMDKMRRHGLSREAAHERSVFALSEAEAFC